MQTPTSSPESRTPSRTPSRRTPLSPLQGSSPNRGPAILRSSRSSMRNLWIVAVAGLAVVVVVVGLSLSSSSNARYGTASRAMMFARSPRRHPVRGMTQSYSGGDTDDAEFMAEPPAEAALFDADGNPLCSCNSACDCNGHPSCSCSCTCTVVTPAPRTQPTKSSQSFVAREPKHATLRGDKTHVDADDTLGVDASPPRHEAAGTSPSGSTKRPSVARSTSKRQKSTDDDTAKRADTAEKVSKQKTILPSKPRKKSVYETVSVKDSVSALETGARTPRFGIPAFSKPTKPILIKDEPVAEDDDHVEHVAPAKAATNVGRKRIPVTRTSPPGKAINPYTASQQSKRSIQEVRGACEFNGCPEDAPLVHFLTPFRNRGAEYNRFLRSAVADIESESTPIPKECFCAVVANFNEALLGPTADAALEDWPVDSVVIDIHGEFSRAGGLQIAIDEGVTMDPERSLMFMVDTDMVIFPGFMKRLLTMTQPGASWFAPIVYSTSGNQSDWTDGFWRVGGSGMIALYRSDFDLVGGEMPDREKAVWGGEDESIANLLLSTSLQPVRVCAPELWHIYHKRASWRHSLSGHPETVLKNLHDLRARAVAEALSRGEFIAANTNAPSSFYDESWRDVDWRMPLLPADGLERIKEQGALDRPACDRYKKKFFSE